MPQLPSITELLEAGAHFGHRTGKWNPKMAPFIFGERKGVHIINVEETLRCLSKALEFTKDLIARGGILVFVGTKKQAQPYIEKYAQECGMPYINERWLGGFLTNFSVVYQLIKKYKTLKERMEKGELKRYTKKEQSLFAKEMERLRKLVGGLENLTKIPDALYVVDIRVEDTALREANRKKIPLVALCDTNTDPLKVTQPIPANDDATKTIELITKLIAQAVKEGKELAQKSIPSSIIEKSQ